MNMSIRSSPASAPDTRAHEAQLVADLVRLSRVTWLYAEEEADKSAFLHALVVPRLTGMSGHEICVFFDRWHEAPLPALLAQLRSAVSARERAASPSSDDAPSLSLAESIKAWQQALDVTFIFVFDRFEDHLATSDRPEAKEFEREFLQSVNTEDLRAHFLMALDEDAVSLLGRLQASTASFGAGSIRLARAAQSHPGEAAPGHAPRPTHSFVGSQPASRPSTSGGAEPAAARDHGPGFVIGSKSTASKLLGTPAGAESVNESIVIATAEAATSRGEHAKLAHTEVTPSSHAHLGKDMPERKAVRAPRAWIALGVLLLSLSCLLLLMLWEPTASTPHTTRIAETPAIAKGPAVPKEPAVPEPAADLTRSSSSQDSDVVASLADDQEPLERPQVDQAPAEIELGGASVQVEPSSESVLQPTVYMHVRNEAQRAWVEQLVTPLEERGIVVTGIKVVGIGPDAPDLRYFRSEEAQEAARVARALGAVGVPPPRLKRIPGFESRSRPRQYELWLAPENLNGPS